MSSASAAAPAEAFYYGEAGGASRDGPVPAEAFGSLLAHPKTPERIMGMMSTGKPLRN